MAKGHSAAASTLRKTASFSSQSLLCRSMYMALATKGVAMA